MTLKKISSSIRTQFLIVMLLLIVIPVITGAIVTYYYFGGYIDDAQQQNITALRDANLFSLQNYLRSEKEKAALLSHDPTIINFAVKVQKYSSANNLTANAFKLNFQKEVASTNRLLSELHSNPVYLIDAKTGLIFFQSEGFGNPVIKPVTAKFNSASVVQFINQIISQRQISISDIAYNALLNKSLCFIGAPITDRNNHVAGVLLVEQTPQTLSKHITTDFSPVRDAEAYLINSTGHILAHTPIVDLSSLKNIKPDPGLLKSNKPIYAKNPHNQTALSAAAKLDLNDLFASDLDWYLIAQIDKTALAGPFNSLRLYLFLIVVILSGLGLVIVFWLSRLVSTPIETINYTLNEVTRGNLKVEVPLFDYGNELDELSQNLQSMVRQLHGQISDVTQHINNISASSTEISATISQVTASSSETASAITETASSSEEVAQLAQSFDEKAKDALTLSNETAEASEKSQEAIQAIYNVIGQVKTQIDEVANSMVNLSKQSQTISEITSVVQEIAEQSNILAINASIEATKAGEYGRSFAVVANEVRNLAEQSKKATQQIRSILDAIQESVTRSVMQVEQTGKIVSEGSVHMGMVNNAVELLSNSINKMIQLVSEVAESSHEQLEGTAQIKEAMENIKQATAQNLDGMRQMEEVITGLKQTAINLKEMISQYKL